VEFEWEEIGDLGVTEAGRLAIPRVPAVPGIYRFWATDGVGSEVYIGESQDLRHRMERNYANKHRGETNVRVREMLLAGLAARRSVRLAIVRAAVMEVDGAKAPADMSKKSVRLLVENAALAIARNADAEIHNLS
jgi:hypothetical protein